MKKKLTLLALLFLSISIFSQNRNGSELTAEGIAKIKVQPDLSAFNITVEKRNIVEKISITELNEEIDKIQKILFKIGFTEQNIKIADYKVSRNQYNNDRNEFVTSNVLIVEFILDKKLIESFYQEIQKENIKDAEIEFETQISENLEKLTRQKLIKSAIENAKSNAENIANALEVKLINVKQVSKYSPRDFDASPMMKVDELKMVKPFISEEKFQKTSFDKFSVQEKELEETITIIYEIAKK